MIFSFGSTRNCCLAKSHFSFKTTAMQDKTQNFMLRLLCRYGINDYFCTSIKRTYKQKNIMRSRTTKWFETKVRYEKTMEDGLQKKVTELYAVDALSFTEAETMITEEMSSYISGEFEISDIKNASYKEIFFSDDASDDRWYKTKLQFITIDEKTEKEKRSNVYYLVQAKSLPVAVGYIEDVMKSTMMAYAIAAIAETTIMDVFEHNKALKNDKPEFDTAG